jgi:hypothetical protein
VSTQLRLVEPPAASRARARAGTGARSRRATTSGAPRARVATGSRRAVHWGDWQLDAQTRRVGRAGVAAARRALEEARQAHELRRAS